MFFFSSEICIALGPRKILQLGLNMITDRPFHLSQLSREHNGVAVIINSVASQCTDKTPHSLQFGNDSVYSICSDFFVITCGKM